MPSIRRTYRKYFNIAQRIYNLPPSTHETAPSLIHLFAISSPLLNGLSPVLRLLGSVGSKGDGLLRGNECNVQLALHILHATAAVDFFHQDDSLGLRTSSRLVLLINIDTKYKTLRSYEIRNNKQLVRYEIITDISYHINKAGSG